MCYIGDFIRLIQFITATKPALTSHPISDKIVNILYKRIFHASRKLLPCKKQPQIYHR